MPIGTRHKIAAQFNIPKKGSTHVINNEIQSDGYMVKDIEEALSFANLSNFLKTDQSDMAVIWDMFILKMDPPKVEEEPVLPTFIPAGEVGGEKIYKVNPETKVDLEVKPKRRTNVKNQENK